MSARSSGVRGEAGVGPGRRTRSRAPVRGAPGAPAPRRHRGSPRTPAIAATPPVRHRVRAWLMSTVSGCSQSSAFAPAIARAHQSWTRRGWRTAPRPRPRRTASAAGLPSGSLTSIALAGAGERPLSEVKRHRRGGSPGSWPGACCPAPARRRRCPRNRRCEPPSGSTRPCPTASTSTCLAAGRATLRGRASTTTSTAHAVRASFVPVANWMSPDGDPPTRGGSSRTNSVSKP